MLFTSSGHWKFDTSDICSVAQGREIRYLLDARDNPLFTFPQELQNLGELQYGEFKRFLFTNFTRNHSDLKFKLNFGSIK